MSNPNQAVLDALGITEKHVFECDIKLRIGELPRVTLVQYLMPGFEATVKHQFDLVLRDEPPPFDLDAMCAAARERLHKGIEESCVKAWLDYRSACNERAIRESVKDAFTRREWAEVFKSVSADAMGRVR